MKKAIERLLEKIPKGGEVPFLEIRRLIPKESVQSPALEDVWRGIERRGFRVEFSRPISDTRVRPLSLLMRDGTRDLPKVLPPSEWRDLVKPLLEDVIRYHTEFVVDAVAIRAAATEGVEKLIELYSDPSSRYRPSAFTCIEESIQRWIDDNLRTIELPEAMLDGIKKVKALHDLQNELGRAPTAAEAAERLRVDERAAKLLLEKLLKIS